MARTTPATRALDALGIAYTLAEYDYDPGHQRVGLQAAEAMGVDAGEVFKTLMAEVDGRPVCAIVPSDAEVNMKKLAAALGGRVAQMMKPDAAERMTGYKVGGISPLGQKRPMPVAIEETALLYEAIFVNGGQRGLQIRLRPDDLIAATGAVAADLLR